MQSSLRDIFLSKTRQQAVLEAHTVLENLFVNLTLREHYAVGHSWSSDKIKDLKSSGVLEDITSHMKSISSIENPLFNQFGVYNKIECSYMYLRAEFLESLGDRYNLDRNISLGALNSISVAASSHSTQCVYPVKTYLVANGYSSIDWDGVLPNTAPVNRAIHFLFGKSMSNHSATILCNSISNELGGGVSPLYINSALWTMGGEL